MPVILDAHKLSYFFVPKVACTSLKYMFYQFENGTRFEPFHANGKLIQIHRLYPSLAFEDCPHPEMADHMRLAVVRDPIDRLLSCYSNRVRSYRELSEAKAGKKLAELGLKPNPPLSKFIAQLKKYRQAHRSIAHHSQPLSEFLGRDPNYFTKIYSLGQIQEFVDAVSNRVGQPLEAERLQTRGKKIDRDVLSDKEIEKLRQFYAEDYDIYGRWF